MTTLGQHVSLIPAQSIKTCRTPIHVRHRPSSRSTSVLVSAASGECTLAYKSLCDKVPTVSESLIPSPLPKKVVTIAEQVNDSVEKVASTPVDTVSAGVENLNKIVPTATPDDTIILWQGENKSIEVDFSDLPDFSKLFNGDSASNTPKVTYEVDFSDLPSFSLAEDNFLSQFLGETSLKSENIRVQAQNGLASFFHSILDDPPYPDFELSDLQGLFAPLVQVDDGGAVTWIKENIFGSPYPAFAIGIIVTVIILRRIKDKEDQEAATAEMEEKRSELDLAAKARARAQRAQEVRKRELLKLKVELLDSIAMMGEDALRPSNTETRESMAKLIDRLEKLGQKIEAPAAEPQGSVGDWELIYASKGTKFTENTLAADVPLSVGVKVDGFTQEIDEEGGAKQNAEVQVGPFGKWRVQAEGHSGQNEDGSTMAFNTLSIVPVELFGIPIAPSVNLPEFRVPLPEPMQKEEAWEDTFVDDTMRISRGETKDSMYVFRRSLKVEAASPSLAISSTATLPVVSAATLQPLVWTPEAQAELDRAPFFVKDRARQKAEEYAVRVGAPQVTMEVVNASK